MYCIKPTVFLKKIAQRTCLVTDHLHALICMKQYLMTYNTTVLRTLSSNIVNIVMQ